MVFGSNLAVALLLRFPLHLSATLLNYLFICLAFEKASSFAETWLLLQYIIIYFCCWLLFKELDSR